MINHVCAKIEGLKLIVWKFMDIYKLAVYLLPESMGKGSLSFWHWLLILFLTGDLDLALFLDSGIVLFFLEGECDLWTGDVDLDEDLDLEEEYDFCTGDSVLFLSFTLTGDRDFLPDSGDADFLFGFLDGGHLIGEGEGDSDRVREVLGGFGRSNDNL